MTLYNQIQQLILRCISRELSVRSFREQFVPLFSSINRRFDIDAAVLADNVDNLYADVLIGDLTEDQFRQKLVQLTPVVTTAEFQSKIQIQWSFGATNTTATMQPTVIGPKSPTSETFSDAQIVEYA